MNEVTSLRACLGNYQYEIVRPWGELPEGFIWGHISQLAVDAEDRVYVFQRSDSHATAPPVVVFSADGVFTASWGTNEFADAHGITISADQRVWLVDRDAHEVRIYDQSGQFLKTLGNRHQPQFQAPFNHPTAVAVASDGEIYVADGYGNTCVHRFSPQGELIQSWGKPGTGSGEFSTPHGIWIDQQNRVLVVDRENNRVQVFDRDGHYLDEWRDFYHPMDIYQDSSGMIYVTDQIPRLSMLSADGELLGCCRPVLNMPHGIWGNSRGDLFIAEMNPTRISKLQRLTV